MGRSSKGRDKGTKIASSEEERETEKNIGWKGELDGGKSEIII